MTNNTLPARDVAFLTALADYLLAIGAGRAAMLNPLLNNPLYSRGSR